MSIYAIGDLHLSLNAEKPMDIFGPNWQNHEKKIEDNWISTVKKEDLVLLPGDFSWKMNLKDMYEDFNYLNKLPGKKLLLKGNHDYWWTTLQSMRSFLAENKFNNIDFIHNNSFEYKGKIIAGTRGWSLNDTENSNKMNHREEQRLKLSLQDGRNKYGEKEIICLMHYPPIIERKEGKGDGSLFPKENTNYIQIMQEYNVKTCLYGHLHDKSHEEAFEGMYKGIQFKLVSCDYLKFELYKINTNT